MGGHKRRINFGLKGGILKAIISLITLTLMLSGCVTKTESHDTNPANWGNHKCVAQGSNGQRYMGWATSDSAARTNAIAICSEHTDSCQLDSCDNEIRVSTGG